MVHLKCTVILHCWPQIEQTNNSCNGAGVGEYVVGDEYFVADDNNAERVNDDVARRRPAQMISSCQETNSEEKNCLENCLEFPYTRKMWKS